MVYSFRAGSHLKGDPQQIGEHVEQLRRQHDGRVTPRVVVDDAAKRRSPLHPHFEWEDARAADLYRLEQARHLVRSLIVSVPDADAPPTRAFVCVRYEGDDENAYTSVAVAMRDPVTRDQVLAAARRELASFRKKYKELDELSEVLAAIDHSLERLEESSLGAVG